MQGIVWMLLLFFCAGSSAEDDAKQPKKSNLREAVKRLQPLASMDHESVFLSRSGQRQEYVEVTVPAYPGLQLEVLTLEDSLSRKQETAVRSSVAEFTAQVIRQNSVDNYGFYSARPYRSGELFHVSARR